MSMLQKILDTMYIEPELLAQLDEEQKQVLFCKIRDEQLKRWRLRDENENENIDAFTEVNKSSNGKRRVRWLTGKDGQIWVWVMGEHTNDETIDTILEREAMEEARRLAEEEESKIVENSPFIPPNFIDISLYEDADTFLMNNVSSNSSNDIDHHSDAKGGNSMENSVSEMEPSNSPFSSVKWRKTPNLKRLMTTDDSLTKRQSEFYQSIKESRDKIAQEAEREAEKEGKYWEQQGHERKSREAEKFIRKIAQKAKEQHRQQILRIISRRETESLLCHTPIGSFLVRVSERIWGYTVSYSLGYGSSKHFLVEKIAQGYQFLGTNQMVHDNLYELVSYHETAPITAKGNEILKFAIGQNNANNPDYCELMTDSILNLQTLHL